MSGLERWWTSRDRDVRPVPTGGRVHGDHGVPSTSVPDVDDDTSRWSETVRDHLVAIAAASGPQMEALDAQALDAAIVSRLVAADRIHSTGLGFTYATPFIDGVHEILTLDLPTGVVALPDAFVDTSRRRRPRLIDSGRRGLQRRLADASMDVARVGERTRHVWTVTSDSPFTASQARFLADVVRTWLPPVDDHNGLVFALPHRHTIVVHPVPTARDAAIALELVPAVAAALHIDGVSRLSPHTYHWLARRVECLSEPDAEGSVVVRPTPFLEGVLERGTGRR